jgi:hypothetical protein
MRALALLFVVSVLGIAHISAQVEESPYIYYHSEALNAIVIERADGTDSRVIARGLMPDNHEVVSGPGWSPSGKWLAWTSANRTEYRILLQRLWVMSADGEERLTFLDAVQNIQYTSWSPTDDYLFTVVSPKAQKSESSSPKLFNNGPRRSSPTFRYGLNERGRPVSRWSLKPVPAQNGP